MKNDVKCSVIGLLLGFACFSATTAAQPKPAAKPPALMDRQKEIALALSACPPTIASKATVYVLEKAGYVKVRDGQNGFSAIVQHSLAISQEPRCMSAEGTRTHLPRILMIATLRAQGKTREEIGRAVADALAKGVLQPPSRTGVDYMLSTENLVPTDPKKDVVTSFPPHVMFYAPYVTNADLGLDGSHSGPVFVAAEGTPYAVIIVPVGAHMEPGHGSDGGGGAR
jgi:hypothetical protein